MATITTTTKGNGTNGDGVILLDEIASVPKPAQVTEIERALCSAERHCEVLQAEVKRLQEQRRVAEEHEFRYRCRLGDARWELQSIPSWIRDLAVFGRKVRAAWSCLRG